MDELAKRLFKTIRKQELIEPGDRAAVAVSGGADSVALLLLLLEIRAELGIVLSVVHVNHKLRGQESDEDEHFVAALARKHDLELHTQAAPLNRPLESGIEGAARKLRYDFFRQLTREGKVSKVATAHTLDDQAETVLLRIVRGAGIRGLSGIHPRLVFEDQDNLRGEVVRPLLGYWHSELETFLHARDQKWREDSSNRDLVFLRNRVRHRLLPLIKEDFGSAAVENLADLAEIALAEEEHWELSHPEISSINGSQETLPRSLALTPLLTMPLAAQRRSIRGWLAMNAPDLPVSFRLIEEVRDLACGPSGRKIELPGGNLVRRTQGDLHLELAREADSRDYEYRLRVPGQVEISELGIRLEAILTDRETVPKDECERLLDPARLPQELVVRNWRAGDRFWPSHTSEEKKVKELLNDRHIIGANKALWPVAVTETHGLVWMRGFSTPANLQSGNGPVLWIREVIRGSAKPQARNPARTS